MTLLGNAIKLLVRPPMTFGGATGGFAGLGGVGGFIGGGPVAQMQAYGSASWLMAVVDRITSGVAMTQWRLYRGRGGPEIQRHPFLDFWSQPNPWYSGEEFLEAGQQHQELTGETWWIIVGEGGAPTELWPVRPDRMRPIADRDQFIRGYIYQVGAERIPLAEEDVLYFKRPNPLDPYRGMSWVQSLLVDIGADREAAAYVRNFFRNGASPGGYIQFDQMMADAEYEKFVQRWREQHQGSSNAHRVAILEGGKFVDAKYSLGREMQFTELRRLHRDTILGGAGVPKSVMGITEDVNRANAEAGEVVFARWCLLPRLRRIRDVVNRRLLPRWGRDLYLDFVDPVPDNRELDLSEAVQGYREGVLTLNEARRRLDEGQVSGGDERKEDPQPGPDQSKTLLPVRVRVADDPLLTSPEERAEATMRRHWGDRLESEAGRITEYVGQFKAVARKIEQTDIEGYAWSWWERWGEEVSEELVRAFEVGALAAEPGVTVPILQQLAGNYARHRSGQLLLLDGDVSLTEFTRRRIRELIAGSIERGDSLDMLQRTLRSDYVFSRSRAEAIARTESAEALGEGRMQASRSQGRKEKHWVTQGDSHVDSGSIDGPCRANARQGWINIDQPFASGHMREPSHVRCRCVVRYRTPPVSDVTPETLGLIAEVRCPAVIPATGRPCGKLVARGHAAGTRERCPRCKAEFDATVLTIPGGR